MLISIIIPTKNRVSKLARVLDTLLRDEYQEKEIIVCDGNSTDGTLQMLQAHGSAIRWISEPDSGEYSARNKGLRMATGDVIKYMSDDDLLQPGVLAYAAEYFTLHPAVDILFNQALFFHEEDDGKMTLIDSRARTSASLQLSSFISGCAPHVASESAFFRRRVIDEIGVFDTTFPFADGEYWTRAAARGLVLDISDYVAVYHCKSRVSGVERKRLSGIWQKWRLARRYGTISNQLYVLLWWIPLQATIWMSYQWMPQKCSLPLRKCVWRWRKWTACEKTHA